jgi:segregation and condensation protein B
MSEIAATVKGGKRVRKPVEVQSPPDAAETSSVPTPDVVAVPSSGDNQIAISDELLGGVEALLFSVDRPLGWARIAAAVGLIDPDAAAEASAKDDGSGEGDGAIGKGRRGRRVSGPSGIVREAISRLNEVYEQSGRAFRIEQVAGGYRVMTIAAHAAVLERFHGARERTALSKAAIETLAIIAYKQPLTRAGLEAIRGVACGEILRALLERRLITIAGRAEELGRPLLYGTNKQFLEVFGLGSLKDLPTVEELRMRPKAEQEPDAAESES